MHKPRNATRRGAVAKGSARQAMMRRLISVILVLSVAGLDPATAQEADPATEVTAAAKPDKTCAPDVGCVTNLPLPRFVSLKGSEGNARRGPGLTHRIDWVFTRAGMPLKITAEFENWRRVEDQDGAGGWVHYSLLSGVRSALVSLDMAEFRDAPDDAAMVVAQAEQGVVGRVLECRDGWCRIATDGQKGWVRTSALWGVRPDETID